MDNIRPSADLRNKYNEMSKLCHENKEPIFITVNGRGDTVIMSIAQYNDMIEEIELLKDLAESEADITAGRVYSFDESMEKLRADLIKRHNK